MRIYPKDPLKRMWKTTYNGIVVRDWNNCRTAPILFLDIDGVLNDRKWKERYLKSLDDTILKASDEKFHQWYSIHCNIETMDMLKEWLDKTGTMIVLTSSWRNTYDIWLTFANLNKEYGFSKMFPYVIGQTCRFNIKRTNGKSWVRGDEIQAWIEEFQPTNYAIVDDDCDMLESQLSQFVHIDPRIGLTNENLNEIENILDVYDK